MYEVTKGCNWSVFSICMYKYENVGIYTFNALAIKKVLESTCASDSILQPWSYHRLQIVSKKVTVGTRQYFKWIEGFVT